MTPVLVVLGANGVVGRGVAEAAVAAGRPVVAVGLDDAGRAGIRERHPGADLIALPAAIASDADAAALARELRALGRSFDGVVASLAGSHPCGRLMDEPADVLQRALDQDLLPHLFAARHLLPLLGDAAAGYVLVGGPGSRYPWAGYGHCSIAAAALRMMARVLHDEAARHGQRVQLLSLDAPVGAARAGGDAQTEADKALAVGRRALSMLDAARRGRPSPIVDYTATLTPEVIAAAPPRARSSSPGAARGRTATPDSLLPARDLHAARALLDAIAFPTSPGNLHDEHC
ncbi:SDR family oxidoreductase [Luteimonas kalidii]|uniref:SDR family oxidoreductase n=1 Tax=Luteimonas kalidii TaxID=3042025 RepID=A0ABT6JQK7_9GAMM|nr:SDR family oxidoreductase [Luteimonas kalidii]MDH5832782.1 SDR family oxidoreductase [Luteimonas kalidii]